MNVQNSEHQQIHTYVPQHNTVHHHATPVRRRINMPKIPMVAQLSAVLSLLLIGAGLLTVNQLNKAPQNLSTQAATGDVALEFEPTTGTLQFNQEKTFNIVATPSNTTMKVTAAVIRVRSEDAELIDVTGVTTTGFSLPIELKPFGVEMENEQIKQWAVTLGSTPQAPFTGKNTIVAIKVKAKSTAGQAKIEIASSSEVAAFDNAGNVKRTPANAAESAKQILSLDISGTTPPPAGTVCWNRVSGTGENLNWPNACRGSVDTSLVCASVVTPLTAEEKTAYRAWVTAGSVVPAACTTTTPPPPATTDPTLNLGFRVQGVVKAGVSQTAEVVIRYKKKNSTEIVKKTYSHTFTSVTPQAPDSSPVGTFRSAQPLVLTGLNMAEVDRLPTSGTFGTGLEVYVKTPTSLRKKLGEITYENNQSIPVRLRGLFVGDAQRLMVGDFVRTGADLNIFDILDISKMVNKYTVASQSAAGTLAEFDTNFDGTFDILDISLVVSNFKVATTTGDNP